MQIHIIPYSTLHLAVVNFRLLVFLLTRIMLKFFRQTTKVFRFNLHKVTTIIETMRNCKEFLQTKDFFCQLDVIPY